MKQLVFPLGLILSLVIGSNTSVIAASIEFEQASSIKTHTVVKRFSTNGRHHQPHKLADTSDIPHNKNITGPSLGMLTPLAGLSSLSAVQAPTVSPVGRWLNHGFSWINSGLGIDEVKPWQKATLAEPVMTGGVAPSLAKFATKVFISKEATLGGNGVAGGGCGCK